MTHEFVPTNRLSFEFESPGMPKLVPKSYDCFMRWVEGRRKFASDGNRQL